MPIKLPELGAVLILLVGLPFLCAASDDGAQAGDRNEYSLLYLNDRLGEIEAGFYTTLWRQQNLDERVSATARSSASYRKSALLILSLLEENNLESAEGMLRDVYRHPEFDGWAGVIRAERYRRSGHTAMARTLFTQALGASNERLVEAACVGMAQLSSDAGRWTQAIEWYERADASLSERLARLRRLLSVLAGKQDAGMDTMTNRPVRDLFRLAGHPEDQVWGRWLDIVALADLHARLERLSASRVAGAEDEDAAQVSIYRKRLSELRDNTAVMYARHLAALNEIVGKDLAFLEERSAGLHWLINLHTARQYEKALVASLD